MKSTPVLIAIGGGLCRRTKTHVCGSVKVGRVEQEHIPCVTHVSLGPQTAVVCQHRSFSAFDTGVCNKTDVPIDTLLLRRARHNSFMYLSTHLLAVVGRKVGVCS